MTDCSVSICRRDAVVEVDFHGHDRWQAFCSFHGYDRNGDLRWQSVSLRTRIITTMRRPNAQR